MTKQVGNIIIFLAVVVLVIGIWQAFSLLNIPEMSSDRLKEDLLFTQRKSQAVGTVIGAAILSALVWGFGLMVKNSDKKSE